MVEVQIRQANGGDAGAISALAFRSKAYWGYDEAFLEACRDELTWSADECERGEVVVAQTADGALAGFYQLAAKGSAGCLEALFVDPPFIGGGIGGVLLRHALTDAATLGCATLELDADPGAEAFYAHFGAQTVGVSPSQSIPNRMLPLMRFRIGDAHPPTVETTAQRTPGSPR